MSLSNDTVNAGAQILLPAAAWGEKDGTVTNSERCISRQRPFLPLPGDAKPDWWIVAEVARRMGFTEGFNFVTAAEVFREHAALSAFENNGARDFDIGGLATLSDTSSTRLTRCNGRCRSAIRDEQRRKAFLRAGRLLHARPQGADDRAGDAGAECAGAQEFPLRLNTGRVRDQWHTMTRSGLSPRLGAHLPEPFVEVHPADAAAPGLNHGGFARVRSPYGACVLKVNVSTGQRRGSLFAPIHWSNETASSARIGDLVTPANDPFSGQPEAKATPATVEPVAFAFRGFALARTRWRCRPAPGGRG